MDCSDLELVTYKTDVLCFGESTGTAGVLVSGGSTPFNYTWSNSSQSNEISNLNAGTYSVTVTDNIGCTVSEAIVVQQNTLMQLTVQATNVSSLGASDGSAVAVVSGGTAPYTYLWSNGATSASVNNLSPATYSVTITDDNGCSENTSITINDINCPDLMISSVVNDVSCSGLSDGTIAVLTSQGQSPYSYSWSTGNAGNTLNNVSAGNYTVQVIDNQGCSESLSITVEEPDALNLSLNKSDLTYLDANDGVITSTCAGGTAPFSYSWSDGSTSSNIQNLSPGNYQLTITDNNGCTTSASETINNIDCSTIYSEVSFEAADCNQANNGSASVSVTGGYMPYSYLWSNNAQSSSINNLSPGFYTVDVIDNLGCTSNQTVLITEPAVLNLSANVTHESIPGANDGVVSAFVSGGTLPYVYSWSDGSNGSAIIQAEPDTYTLTVTDANGCSISQSFTINAAVITCEIPENFELVNLAGQSAAFTWDEVDGATSYIINYRKLTGSLGWTSISSNFNFIIINNLDQCDQYEVKVRSRCGSNGTSAYTSNVIFETGNCNEPCLPITGLYTSNFTESSGILVWDLYAGSTYKVNYRKLGEQWEMYESPLPLVILFGLDDCSTYQWYVEVNCPNGQVSQASSTQFFNTSCNMDGTDGEDIRTFGPEEILDFEITAYPNPAEEFVNLNWEASEDEISKIKLTDLNGKVLFVEHVFAVKGQNQLQLDFSSYSTGMYLIVYESNNTFWIEKIQKK